MTHDELEALVVHMQSVTPVVEELMVSTVITSWGGFIDLTTAQRMTIMVAPIPVRVLSVDIGFDYWNLPASSTDYWTAVLEKGTNPAGFPDIATRATQNTGANANGPIVARTSWNFDAAEWNEDADMAKGELLCLLWSKTGSPAALHLPMTVTTRYRPL